MTSAAIDPYAAPRSATTTWNDIDELAPLFDRLVAKVVDNVVGVGTLFPGVVGMLLVGGPEAIERDPAAGIVIAAGVLMTMGLILAVLVTQTWWLATRGQTIGKRAVGIHIVKVDGSPADFVSAVLLRAWVPALVIGFANQLCLGWLVSLANLLPGLGAERRCLHDHLAGTRVVAGMPTHLG